MSAAGKPSPEPAQTSTGAGAVKAPDKSDTAARARTIKAQERMLTALREGMTIKAAAKKAGIHRDTYYAWTRSDPAFAVMASESIVEMASEDAREGLAAFLQKRPPVWRNR